VWLYFFVDSRIVMAIWNQVVESECMALLEADAQSPRFEFDRLDAPNDEYIRYESYPNLARKQPTNNEPRCLVPTL
jgi:hypothetical protein